MARYQKMIVLLLLAFLVLGPYKAYAQSNNPPLSIHLSTAAGQSVQYPLRLYNQDSVSHRYLLSLSSLPSNFSGLFLQDGRVVTELTLESESVQTLMLKVEALPQAIERGGFQVVVERDDGQAYSLPLSIDINRDYVLSINDSNKNLMVLNGQTLHFDLTVTNTGSKALAQLQPRFQLPHHWLVQHAAPQALTLDPGENGVFQVDILVPSSQPAGNQKLDVSVGNELANSPPLTIPVQVQQSPHYLILSLVLILAAVVGTTYYFRKHGRR